LIFYIRSRRWLLHFADFAKTAAAFSMPSIFLTYADAAFRTSSLAEPRAHVFLRRSRRKTTGSGALRRCCGIPLCGMPRVRARSPIEQH